jgi:hypothetical protein
VKHIGGFQTKKYIFIDEKAVLAPEKKISNLLVTSAVPLLKAVSYI